MNFYSIYSGGGGAGDWGGVNRVWLGYMKPVLKQRVLLKFGDVFLEHASGKNFYRPRRWEEITDLRQWLFQCTSDAYVLKQSDILLDSGTAKAVSWINTQKKCSSCKALIENFKFYFDKYRVLDKYVDIVVKSNINSAVTFDIPNPFKIRTDSDNKKLNILNASASTQLVKVSADYANTIYSMLKKRKAADNVLMPIINGMWSEEEIYIFLSSLSFTPKKIAIGGLASIRSKKELEKCIQTLKKYDTSNYMQVHYLGCGGLSKVEVLKKNGIDSTNISVDCSTPINRSIDGNLAGTAKSGYFQYDSKKLIRIEPGTVEQILEIHKKVKNAYYTEAEMEDILYWVLKHQSHQSSYKTYEARAKLIFHNYDVHRRFAD